jgi:putative peptidoglycan lipid II flippase
MISLFIGTMVASARDSAVTVFSLAFNINALPLGVLALSFVTTIFPYLSESFAQEDEESFRAYLTVTMSRIIYVLIPITALMLTYRAQIVRVIYGGGEFSWDDTRLTIQAFTLFALSIPFQGLIPLFSRALYARHDTKTPMMIGILGMVINTILSIFLLFLYGVQGVALAFSLTMLIVCLIYATVVFRVVNHGTILSTIWYGLQVGLVSLFMLVIAYILRNFIAERMTLQSTTLTLFMHMLLSSVPALGLYALITWRTKLMQRLQISQVRKELALRKD